MKTLDAGQAETNKLIEKVEKRVNKEYSQATKDMQKKLNDYLKSFESKDKAMQKQLADGLITEKQYKDWRYGQIMVGKRWQEQLDVLSKDLENSRQIAMNIVSGELPSAFAIGHNYGTYLVESGTSLNTSYTLYNRDTVSKLIKDRPKLLPDPTKGSKTAQALKSKQIQKWSKAKMTSAVAQGVLQGESIPKIASRLRSVTDMSYRASIRNARTMLTSSENLGRQASFERAQDMGIEMEKQWLAALDDRTRDSHALMDGERVPLDENFSNGLEYPADPSGEPEEIYNCFAGETKIASDSNVVRSYKHKYDGKIISIKTAGGVQFSCTPNHPILTPSGWVAAELLNNGDNILVTHGENNVFSRVNPYIDHRFPRIDAIHKFGKKTRGQRTCGLSVNFHGDVSTADVEVVTHKRFLWDGIDACRRNCINKFLLKLSNKTISRFGSLVEHFWSVCMTSFSLISRKCKSLPFFKCSMSHSCKHGFGTIANGDGVLTEYSINDLPADTVIDGELLNRLSCKVFIDTIVNVDVSTLSIHVYNLQTENGYYFVNSIIPQDAEKNSGIFAIAKNCRCTMVTAIKGFEKALTDFDLSENEKLHGMTYDEWKESHLHNEVEQVVEEVAETIAEVVPFEWADAYEEIFEDNNQEFVEALYDNNAAATYNKYSDRVEGGFVQKSGSGFYRPSDDSVTWDYRKGSLEEGYNKFGTFCHEFGHAVDYHIAEDVSLTFKETDKIFEVSRQRHTVFQYHKGSNSDEFLAAFRKDKENLRSAITGDDAVKMIQDIRRHTSTGLQDAFDGMFGTRSIGYSSDTYLPWGHGERYYNRNFKNLDYAMWQDKQPWKIMKDELNGIGMDLKKKGDVQAIFRDHETASELWANLHMSISIGGEELEMFEKYMPNSLSAFREIIGKI